MRIILLAAVSFVAVNACSKTEAPAPAASTPAASTPMAAAPAPSSADAAKDMSNMPGMDMSQMAAAAAKDAGPLQVTSDNHMFHVMQGTKEEKVVLPATAGVTWTPDKPTSDFYALKDTASDKLADGAPVQVFTFSMLKSGNATVVFKSSGDKSETRTINFMIH